MDLLPDTYNCGLRKRRVCRERFPRHRLQREPLVSDPGMHVGIVNPRQWENVHSISGACATPNFRYLARGPWKKATGRQWWQWVIYNKGLFFIIKNNFNVAFSQSHYNGYRCWFLQLNDNVWRSCIRSGYNNARHFTGATITITTYPMPPSVIKYKPWRSYKSNSSYATFGITVWRLWFTGVQTVGICHATHRYLAVSASLDTADAIPSGYIMIIQSCSIMKCFSPLVSSGNKTVHINNVELKSQQTQSWSRRIHSPVTHDQCMINACIQHRPYQTCVHR